MASTSLHLGLSARTPIPMSYFGMRYSLPRLTSPSGGDCLLCNRGTGKPPQVRQNRPLGLWLHGCTGCPRGSCHTWAHLSIVAPQYQSLELMVDLACSKSGHCVLRPCGRLKLRSKISLKCRNRRYSDLRPRTRRDIYAKATAWQSV
jgi:hypothetical protein